MRSANYRPIYRQFLLIFFAAVIGLGYLGSQEPSGGYVIAARILTVYYFGFFLVILPLLGLLETTKPLPNSISEAVLRGSGGRRRRRRRQGLAEADMISHRMHHRLRARGVACGTAMQTASAEDAPPRQKWSFSGPFGIYDPAQLQRGFQIYREVCSTCHSIKLLAFRNLADPGGPAFTEAQATAVASSFQVTDGPNDQGQMFQRPGTLADRFPPPFPNDQAARAALGGKLPPDMSVLAKARGYEWGFPRFVIDAFTMYQEDGPDYIHAILNGYTDPPAGFALPPGGQYNKYFPGGAIGMPKPLSDGQVQYTDGTPMTVDQYGRDVAAFLMWAAEPTLDARKRLGFQVMIFLIVLTGLLYFTKKKVWHDVHHPEADVIAAAGLMSALPRMGLEP